MNASPKKRISHKCERGDLLKLRFLSEWNFVNLKIAYNFVINAERGDLLKIKDFIKNGTSVNSKDSNIEKEDAAIFAESDYIDVGAAGDAGNFVKVIDGCGNVVEPGGIIIQTRKQQESLLLIDNNHKELGGGWEALCEIMHKVTKQLDN
ncbi:Hypothetical predicted protein [Mytilus galloprovincialis]|uniref:Uncharacterized protein n=1 Tax=Mytilus galloprovincialis TaxID=29158 RepID=A0A8B6EPT0_MYTGA|nr:Hypothetical predicted protein [Mytilus galloprovincialis]